MRRTALLLGTGLAAAAWLSPLPALAAQSFAAHMALHVTIVAIAAPLLALGLAGSRFDLTGSLPTLFAAVPAALVEFLLVWGWHAPALHEAARRSTGVFALEQASFLLAGLVVWLAAFGGCGPERRARTAGGVLALLLTSMHMTLLGALFLLSPRPLCSPAGASLGLTPLQDQQIGGTIMLAVGGVSYLAGGLVLVRRLLREPEGAART